MKKNTAPRHLSPPTRTWFNMVMVEYDLEPHHVRLLTLACEAWDRCTEARKALKKHGLTFEDRFGQPHARPEAKVENDSRTAFARLLRELALDVEAPEPPRPPGIRGQANLQRGR